MLRNLLSPVCLFLICLCTLAATARADTIDDFTFTTAEHTLTFSLPALIPDYYPPGYPPPGPHVGIDNYFTSAAGSIDGVAGHTFGLDFLTEDGALFRLGFILTPDAAAAPNYKVSGPILVAGPLTDFPLGTFSYTDAFPTSSTDPAQIFEGPYTLTIAQQVTLAPEPGTLLLLLTGAATTLPLVRRRHTAA